METDSRGSTTKKGFWPSLLFSDSFPFSCVFTIVDPRSPPQSHFSFFPSHAFFLLQSPCSCQMSIFYDTWNIHEFFIPRPSARPDTRKDNHIGDIKVYVQILQVDPSLFLSRSSDSFLANPTHSLALLPFKLSASRVQSSPPLTCLHPLLTQLASVFSLVVLWQTWTTAACLTASSPCHCTMIRRCISTYNINISHTSSFRPYFRLSFFQRWKKRSWNYRRR